MKRLLPLCLILAFLLPGATVSAREAAPDIQQFKPVTDMQGFLLVQDATLMPQFRPGFAMTFNYALNPFEVHLLGYGRQFGITDGIVGGDLTAAIGLFDWWEVGMRFPFMQIPIEAPFIESIESFGGKQVGYGIGDLTFATRFRALDPDKYKVGFAPGLFLTLPTGNERAALGRGKPGGGIRLAVSQSWDRFHFAVNLGYGFYPRATVANLTTGDELFYSVGVGVSPIVGKLDVRVELDGSLTPGPNDDDEERFGDLTHSPLEVAASVQYKFGNGFAVHGGLGTGLTPGFGSPALRVFAGASWAKFGPRDRDKDGIVDPDDACVKEPEDMDGFEDADGCPDPDNDGDGFPDDQDKCPDEAEDKDGYFDGDGCIDPDNDGDGLLDGEDACVDEAEDMDGFQDEDGCPDLDNDGDGILDSEDSCPDAPETVDGWKDEDGCPDPDNDGDTFLDVDDLCPDRAEEMNGDRDDDGCPDDVLVARKGETIHLLQKVKFSKKGKISRKSKDLVLALAQFLTEQPGILQVRIEGHTSSKGKEQSNLKVSGKEAKAVVKRLIKYGVDASRLEAVGYGETRPIRSNRTKSGRAANRRIEVTVLSDRMSDESSEAVPVAPAGPADASDPWGTSGPNPAEIPDLNPSDSPWGEESADEGGSDGSGGASSSEAPAVLSPVETKSVWGAEPTEVPAPPPAPEPWELCEQTGGEIVEGDCFCDTGMPVTMGRRFEDGVGCTSLSLEEERQNAETAAATCADKGEPWRCFSDFNIVSVSVDIHTKLRSLVINLSGDQFVKFDDSADEMFSYVTYLPGPRLHVVEGEMGYLQLIGEDTSAFYPGQSYSVSPSGTAVFGLQCFEGPCAGATTESTTASGGWSRGWECAGEDGQGAPDEVVGEGLWASDKEFRITGDYGSAVVAKVDGRWKALPASVQRACQ